MRMYNLDNRTTRELIKLLDTVKSHNDLTVDEKTANIEAINSKLNLSSKKREDVLKDIEDGSADISDINGVFK